MAVEPHHHNLLPDSQYITQRRNSMNTQMDPCGIPLHYQSNVCDFVPIKTISEVNNCGMVMPETRRRYRDASFDGLNGFNVHPQKKNSTNLSVFSSFVNEKDLNLQSNIDRIISQHTARLKTELEERTKEQWRVMASMFQRNAMKKLNEKDDEIQRAVKTKSVLEEKIKTLLIENQLWRDLAINSEAAANKLRTNLEQLLAYISEEHHGGAGGTVGGKAESSGSNNFGEYEAVEKNRRIKAEEDSPVKVGGDGMCRKCGKAESSGSNNFGEYEAVEKNRRIKAEEDSPVKVGGDGMCRKCGEGDSRVLLLPCRHLCLCSRCGGYVIRTCPLCKDDVSGSVRVNMSS